RNGHVRAWVGSSDFAVDQYDHVAQARRQPGSTFKPFVYGAALMEGFRVDDTFVDQPVTLRGKGGDVWSPRDVTPPTGRSMTLREGLVQSRNSITAQLMDRVGPAKVAKLAQAMGVRESRLDEVPSLALGTSPVTLREMVAAYSAIANKGEWLEPLLVLRVEDATGKVLEGFVPGKSQQAMPTNKALQLVNVMRGVVDEGTGTAIRSRYGIQADVAGKTGTTQDNTDAWFILMHPQLVAGAWIGFNDPRTTMADAWGTGARGALPIVGDFFQQSLRSRWIEGQAEFAIPRPRPKPPQREVDPVEAIIQEVFGRLVKILQ
ncbi:MAG TPA: penicillin-binding transpeptidase domain-containing protein, partial [Ramlibacter sp.]|nr:penicillin-binding transpeptidase domain-containing protein [Ramlibacter sp.]